MLYQYHARHADLILLCTVYNNNSNKEFHKYAMMCNNPAVAEQ